MNPHIQYLQHALTLAQKKRGFCAPNPSVGVVVVKDQQVIATGFHAGAGKAHAEAEALQQLSPEQAKGSTVYVTLEPCCHHGKTPPCTELLIQRGVAAVYYSFTDPNPLVSGRGQQQLQAAGIQCEKITLPEIDAFYESYQHWTDTGRPRVLAKLAMSLDGKIAGPNGERIAITGEKAQEFTHQYRKQVDAILTTVKTVIHDDPQLNIRLPSEETLRKPVYVLDKHLDFPQKAKLLQTAEKITLFHQPTVEEKRKKWLESHGIRCVAVKLKNKKIDIEAVLEYIGHDGVHDLLLEAGGVCFEAFMLEKHIDRAFIYMALKWLGPEAQSAFMHKTPIFDQAQDLKWHILGDEDVVCEFTPSNIGRFE